MTGKEYGLVAILIASLGVDGCFAFETDTHAAITAQALAQSNLGASPTSSSLSSSLGLLDYGSLFGIQYLDIDLTNNVSRVMWGGDFEAKKTVYLRRISREQPPDLGIPDDYTIGGWVVRGSIREDDNQSEVPSGDIGNDPNGVFIRMLGHFYDPINNRAIVLTNTLAALAPDWALVPGTSVTDPLSLSVNRTNHFNVNVAREAMWRALTLQDATGVALPPPLQNGAVYTGNAEQVQKLYWATSFRALGNVVHLLQDMAQPQHTRNDIHAGKGCLNGSILPASKCFLGGHDSFLERYLSARTGRETDFHISDGNSHVFSIKQPQLTYAGYPLPDLDGYRAYFTGNVGKGLADYSNGGFYSAGTNINSADAKSFPTPDPTGQSLGVEVITPGTDEKPVDMVGDEISGAIRFYTGPVIDFYSSALTDTHVRLSSAGLWDQFLEIQGSTRTGTLNYYNYNAQADKLIPRATAYSAGFINYFFRGHLTIGLPSDGVYAVVDHAVENTTSQGFRKLRVSVQNTTPPAKGNTQNMVGGNLVAVMRFHRNTRYQPDLSGEWGELPDCQPDPASCRTTSEEIVVSKILTPTSMPKAPTLNYNATPVDVEFDFTDNPIPINATDVYLQIVYRGPLGSEADAVVVETKDISEPIFTTYNNVTDYIFCSQGAIYYRDSTGALPGASPDVQASAPAPASLINLSAGYGASVPNPVTSPLVSATTLDPGHFVRYAILGELNTKWTASFQGGAINFDPTLTDLKSRANQIYYSYDPSTKLPKPDPHVSTMRSARNVYTASGEAFYQVADGSTCPDLSNYNPFALPPATIVQVTITRPTLSQ